MGENKKKKTSGNQKDREEYGYGYDRSVDDLKVIGDNKNNVKNPRPRREG